MLLGRLQVPRLRLLASAFYLTPSTQLWNHRSTDFEPFVGVVDAVAVAVATAAIAVAISVALLLLLLLLT